MHLHVDPLSDLVNAGELAGLTDEAPRGPRRRVDRVPPMKGAVAIAVGVLLTVLLAGCSSDSGTTRSATTASATTPAEYSVLLDLCRTSSTAAASTTACAQLVDFAASANCDFATRRRLLLAAIAYAKAGVKNEGFTEYANAMAACGMSPSGAPAVK